MFRFLKIKIQEFQEMINVSCPYEPTLISRTTIRLIADWLSDWVVGWNNDISTGEVFVWWKHWQGMG